MKYIGNKTRILDFIKESMDDFGIPLNGTFIDIFSGTASVGYFFKKIGFRIISNDFMKYSYITQYARISLNNVPLYKGLPMKEFEKVTEYLLNLNPKKGYCFENYAPSGKYGRRYFSDINAKRIDAIRDQIESWYLNKNLNMEEYYYLIASLIDGADYVANISGTYGAYLKIWRSMAFKDLPMRSIEVFDNKQDNIVFNEDANKIISDLDGDVLYIDPPYNQRQYASNFHVLESIAVWDKQELSGKTGLRNYSNQKSKYCYKSQAFDVLSDLIKKSKTKYIVLSYNNEGIISHNKIIDLLKNIGRTKIYSTNYRRFRTDSISEKRQYKVLDDKVNEYLFICERVI